LRGRLDRARAELGRAGGALRPSLLERKLERASERLASLARMRELVDPERPLALGFARIEDRTGHTLTNAASARRALSLTLHFADGQVAATVDGALERPIPKRHIPPKPEQPKLF
jgi:exodeoxyribonuclease VII large subunit